MAFLPSDFIGGQLHWLLDFVVKDTTLRFSHAPISAEIDGTDYEYQAGLEFSQEFADGISPFGMPTEHGIEVTLHASLVSDIAREIMKGYDLAAARGRLWLYEANAKSAVLFLDGVVRSPEFGGIDEPLTFSLEEVLADDTGLFPPALAVIDHTTWPLASEHARGERYPWIFGAPGYHYESTTSPAANVGFGYGSPAHLVVKSGTQKLLIAGHHVDAAQVTIINEGTGSFNPTVTVENTVDGRGNAVALCPITVTCEDGSTTAQEDETFFVKWHNAAGTSAGGVMLPNGSMMSGAGDVLRYMLSHSRLRIDHGRVAAAIPRLNQFRIDTAIVCAPDGRFSPWSWIEDHLQPILPISWRVSPGERGGWYPVVWPFDATSHDAVANIRATSELHAADTIKRHSELVAGTAFREGRASFTERSSVVNEFTIDYQNDYKDGAYWKRKTLTGDPDVLAADVDAGSNIYCHLSRTRYRGANNLPQSIPESLASDVVWEDATAVAVMSWRSRRDAMQSIVVSYIVDAEVVCHVEPGDVILVSDAELEFEEYLFVVEQITWRADRFLALELVSMQDAARDMHGAEGGGGH